MSYSFPFFASDSVKEKNELPIYTDIAWDYTRDEPVVKDGQFVITQKNEALKAWAFRALRTARFKQIIYSAQYGCEIESLIGTPYTRTLAKAECMRFIKECLGVNPYITEVLSVSCEFLDGTIEASCEIATVYGELSVEGVRVNF